MKPYWINPIEGLDYVLRSLKVELGTKTVFLLANTESPLNLQPFRGIIDMIADALDVPADRLTVCTRDHTFHHPRSSVKLLSRFNEADIRHANTWLKNPVFVRDSEARLFGCFFGRASIPRLLLAHHLEMCHGSRSTVSLLCKPDVAEYNIAGLQEHFFPEIHSWLQSRQNRQDTIPAVNHLGSSDDMDPVKDYPRIWKEYQIEVAVETEYQTPCSVSEKTIKCLASGKPFLVMAGTGTLRWLRELGFQTFQDVIDESYDSETDWYRRLHKILQEIDRLASLDDSELTHLLAQMDLYGQHNRQHFFHNQDWYNT
jgi:hypothetical protein